MGFGSAGALSNVAFEVLVKQLVQFSHANGFPAKSYSYLFSLLDAVDWRYINCMGHGAFAVNGDLNHLADELIDSLEQRGGAPVDAVGHSSGGVVTLFAAMRRPELFRQVVLLDPVLFQPLKRGSIALMKRLGKGDAVGPTRKAMTRRTDFDDHDQARAYFGGKAFFKGFHARCFEDYVQHGLKAKASGGLTLTFAQATEVEIFRSVPLTLPKAMRRRLQRVGEAVPGRVAVTLVYASGSDVLWPSDIRWLRWAYPAMNLVRFEGGHLFPFEEPEQTAGLLARLLAGNNPG